ncbi:MAG: ribonuclease HI [Chloroflexi bacterium]|nr:ribonuclease HI [Chloroflexota bacterium]
MNDLPRVTIHTDGSAIGNPGPGGYGVVMSSGGHRKELSGGYRRTTNNRMEILACIVALEALKQPCRVTLHSDSRYVVDAMAKGWARKWQANGWMRNKTERALNPDLWERLLALAAAHDVDFRWVRGHAGVVENERADRLAVAAAQSSNLPPDEPYETAASRAPGVRASR